MQDMSSRDWIGNSQARVAHFLSPNGQACFHTASNNTHTHTHTHTPACGAAIVFSISQVETGRLRNDLSHTVGQGFKPRSTPAAGFKPHS